MDHIVIRGAREHNLKNIDLTLPRDKIIVVSGLSGSGKSSLAFDTIFAEGQRRYVESLSSYARQFLGRLDKPDVDYIEGLSPAVSIEQKTTHRNPRSTVGTVTEIYDYLRLLYARVGVPHCPRCGRVIREQTVDQIVEHVLGFPEDSRVTLLAPVVKLRKGRHEKILEDARKAGFVRVRVDGEVRSLDEDRALDKNQKHSIELVVDRLRVKPDARARLSESVEAALSAAQGELIVARDDGTAEEYFSQRHGCPECGISIPELEPQLFSFNSPVGACPECSGLGITMEFDPELVIPNRDLSFEEGGIAPYNPKANWHRSLFVSLSKHYGFSLKAPIKELPERVIQILLHGTDEKVRFSYTSGDRRGKWEYTSGYRGVLKDLKRRYQGTTSEGVRQWLEGFMSQRECTACRGKRLREESLAVTVGNRSIHDLSAMSIEEADRFMSGIDFGETERKIARQVLKAVRDRLGFLMSVGLDYLTLDRKAATLSGGEAQRIRLATQIGSSLVGVLYILDEPTIGLHQRDNSRLIETLVRLRDAGNTLIVVEHDEQTLRSADYIVDLGPGAGVHGGEVVAAGTCQEIMSNPDSLTGRYLSHAASVPYRSERRPASGKRVLVRGAREHNLKGIDVAFPLGCLTAITGVSGSGKSTLLNDILLPALSNRLGRTHHPEGAHEVLEGWEEVDKVISIDQSPIGRTPRSNPATYVGLFGPIRELFAALPEAKARGYAPGRFSFNVKGGRCDACEGDGVIRIEMQFLPDVYITCDQCHGRRYNSQTLEVRYKGKNVYEVLELTVDEAVGFFRHIPSLASKLETLQAVGLGYITLGQSALTLSGGEAQRVKLSQELSRRSTGRTLYILDEPTTGLHFDDVRRLIEVLQLLVNAGNSVVLIEHNIDVILQADWVVDLGPEGGARGGELIASGTPEEIMRVAASYTGRYLSEAVERRRLPA